MNTYLAYLALSALAGPVQIDGKDTKVILAGGAKLSGGSLALNGGNAILPWGVQRSLDTQIKGKPFAVVVSLKDATSGDATAVTVGPITLLKKAGSWTAKAGSGVITLGPATGMKLVLTADGSSLRAYKNGRAAGFASYSAAPYAKVALGSPKGTKGPWKGSILEFNVIPRSLMPAAAQTLSQSSEVRDVITTVKAELVQFTVVPEPKDVLPYKHALITQEYKILGVSEGSVEGVTVGATVRIARWGIIGGQKTSLANMKKGDVVNLKVGLFENFPQVATEFTVDKLPENFDAPYLFDTEKPN